MTLTKLKIKDLINDDAKLTFLVGAGCSVDEPSCLPAGRMMIKAIVKYTCVESEIEKILKLEDLRFEQLVEIVRDHLDKDLKIIDYYGQCDKPNLQHFFLAEMINKGHFLMTTNFDFLIENALLQLNVLKKNIIPVITKDDFLKYNDPIKLAKNKKKTVYKIHGSTKNVISGEDTRDTLIATIQAFGSNKEGDNVFQVEPFKRELFNNISNGRSLVVMGYSGSDDFDIVPTLKVLKNIQNIVWINYTEDIEMRKEEIHEIDASSSDSKIESNKDLKKVSQILLEIKLGNNVNHVYRVDVNTTKMVEELLDTRPKLNTDNFLVTSKEWLEKNIEMPNKFVKFSIPYKIYDDFDIYDGAIRCLEEIFRLSEESEDQYWKSFALGGIGMIYETRGQYEEALERYEEALRINVQLGDWPGVATFYSNIGTIFKTRGQYEEALERYEKSLKIEKQLGDLLGKVICLNNIGLIYLARGQYDEALERCEESLKIAEQLGDLSKKATCLNNIGLIYEAKGQQDEALERYEEGLKIADQLGELNSKAVFLNNIGMNYKDQRQHDKALIRFEEVLKINEQLGNLLGKATVFNNIGLIHKAKMQYDEALERYEESLEITEQLGASSVKAMVLNNIGNLYESRAQFEEALEWYNEALKIHEHLGELSMKATVLNHIGMIYSRQGNFSEGLKWNEKALKILISLGLGDSPEAKRIEKNITLSKKMIQMYFG